MVAEEPWAVLALFLERSHTASLLRLPSAPVSAALHGDLAKPQWIRTLNRPPDSQAAGG